MLRTLRKAQRGFTIIELLIVIAIIGILAGLVLNNFQGAQAKARDTQRRTDINNIHAKLEEFYNEKGGYPNENLTTTLLPGIDASALTDADNATIVNTFSTGTEKPTPTPGGTNEYAYAAYGCAQATSTAGALCTKYTLAAFIERPAQASDNPYRKDSLN